MNRKVPLVTSVRNSEKMTERHVFQISKQLFAVVKLFGGKGDSEPPKTVKLWDVGDSSLEKTMSFWNTQEEFQPDTKTVDYVTNVPDALLYEAYTIAVQEEE